MNLIQNSWVELITIFVLLFQDNLFGVDNHLRSWFCVVNLFNSFYKSIYLRSSSIKMHTYQNMHKKSKHKFSAESKHKKEIWLWKAIIFNVRAKYISMKPVLCVFFSWGILYILWWNLILIKCIQNQYNRIMLKLARHFFNCVILYLDQI